MENTAITGNITQGAGMPVWKLQDVSFAYISGREVLSAITLKFFPGHIYGILGPNGSGKTTLLDLLGGLGAPGTGNILYNGRNLGDYGTAALARRVALVPQDFLVRFPFNVRDVVEMGLHPHLGRFALPSHEDMDLVTGIMEELDIHGLADRPVTMLSGGEKQRVAVARALVQAREALLFDEATSNLDIFHSLSILDAVKRRAVQQGLCIVAAVHDINLAAFFCDELVFLKDGRVVETGTPESVLSPELIRYVYNVDARVRRDEFTGRPAVSFMLAGSS